MILNETYYYARAFKNYGTEGGTYEVIELVIKTIEADYFVGLDVKTKQRFLFSNKDLERLVFKDRDDALKLVKMAEKKNCGLKELNYDAIIN